MISNQLKILIIQNLRLNIFVYKIKIIKFLHQYGPQIYRQAKQLMKIFFVDRGVEFIIQINKLEFLYILLNKVN